VHTHNCNYTQNAFSTLWRKFQHANFNILYLSQRFPFVHYAIFNLFYTDLNNMFTVSSGLKWVKKQKHIQFTIRKVDNLVSNKKLTQVLSILKNSCNANCHKRFSCTTIGSLLNFLSAIFAHIGIGKRFHSFQLLPATPWSGSMLAGAQNTLPIEIAAADIKVH